jgi:hypothetical protein
MDLMKRKPVNANETLDPFEIPKTGTASAPATPVSWETTIREAENELERARLLVGTLEALIAHYRTQMQAGFPARPLD